MGKKPPQRPSTRLSEEDRQLFRQAMEGTRPLPPRDTVEAYRAPARTVPLPPARPEAPLVDGLSDALEIDAVESADELLYARSGIQHAVLRKLRRGQFGIDAELDLHGLHIEEARAAIARLLSESRQRQWRCVRIIHGKGYGSQSSQPVLKNRVNSWLRQRDEVLAFCSARPADGGTGALYLLLKL